MGMYPIQKQRVTSGPNAEWWRKLVGAYAAKTGRRKRSAEKKLLHIGATKKRTASLKVVRNEH